MSEYQPQPESSGKARRWLKYSCLGCLVIVGLPVVVVTVVALIWLATGCNL